VGGVRSQFLAQTPQLGFGARGVDRSEAGGGVPARCHGRVQVVQCEVCLRGAGEVDGVAAGVLLVTRVRLHASLEPPQGLGRVSQFQSGGAGDHLDLAVVHPVEETGVVLAQAAPRTTPHRYLLRIRAGTGDLTPTPDEGHVTFTTGQFAVWYAGGWRSPETARLSGVHTRSDAALAGLLKATAGEAPWLPDHF
jgi:hypothetical protein